MAENGKSALILSQRSNDLRKIGVKLHSDDYITIPASKYPHINAMPHCRSSEDWGE